MAIPNMIPVDVIPSTRVHFEEAPLHDGRPKTKSKLHFLVRDDLYLTEKQYSIQFEPHGDVPQTNVKQEVVDDIPIYDIRPEQNNLSFDEDGFLVRNYSSKMRYEDFGNPDKVKEIYLEEIRILLAELFDTPNVAILEYLVRRRHTSFPIFTGEEFEFAQPVATAHIDFSPGCITDILKDRYGDRAQSLMQYPYKLVNIWKPLVGPIRDWPLALCKPKSIDINSDFCTMDRVYIGNIEESIQIHYNPHQEWCYISNHEPSELLIFRAGDSRGKSYPAVPHCAFPHRDGKSTDLPRESVEVRAFVFAHPEELALQSASETRRHGPKASIHRQ